MRRSGSLAVLALLTMCPSAQATTIFPFEIPTTVTFEWTPSTGPVTGYGVVVLRPGVAAAPFGDVVEPEVTITAAPGDTYRVAVWPFAADGRLGPISNPSIQVRAVPVSEPTRLVMLAVGCAALGVLNRR
jgi:hypothetical protein